MSFAAKLGRLVGKTLGHTANGVVYVKENTPRHASTVMDITCDVAEIAALNVQIAYENAKAGFTESFDADGIKARAKAATLTVVK